MVDKVKPHPVQFALPVKKWMQILSLMSVAGVLTFSGSSKASASNIHHWSLYPTLSWSLLVDAQDPDLFAQYRQDLSSIDPRAYLIREDDIEKKISMEIQKMNRLTISDFLGKTKASHSVPGNFRKAEAKTILHILSSHPVVGNDSVHLYDMKNGQVGFCFGRAHYTHVELLRKGIKPEQIVKIFAMGGLLYKNLIWDYHVATAVQGPENNWWVIDSLFPEIMELRDWVQKVSEWDGNQVHPMLRYYIMPAWKFQPIKSVSPNYSLYQQLYGAYFRDLTIWHFSNPQQIVSK